MAVANEVMSAASRTQAWPEMKDVSHVDCTRTSHLRVQRCVNAMCSQRERRRHAGQSESSQDRRDGAFVRAACLPPKHPL